MLPYEKEYEEFLNEHMDLSDRETLHYVTSLDEAGQDQLLTSLTGKLYDKIVEKVDNIDFGTIPNSRGDITQIENFESMVDCLHIIRDIVKQYNQSTEPIDQVETAIQNIRDRERLFSRCYTMNVEMGIIIYNTMVLSVVSSLSYLIATSIDFIKTPTDEIFQVSLDRIGYAKTTQSMLYNDLRKFNIACKKGEVDKSLDMILSQRGARAMSGGMKDVLSKVNDMSKGEKIALGALGGLILAKTVILPLAKNILPLIQNLVYIHYANQQAVSDYFAVQADLLQANTALIEYRDDLTPEKKKKIIDGQTKIANRMRKLSNKFQIRFKGAEVDAERLAKSEYKKFSKEDLDTADGGLF